MKRPLVKFLVLAYALTWLWWAAAGAISNPTAPPDPALAALGQVLLYLGTFTPGLLALLLTERGEGREATRRLIGRIFKWDVGARWYVFAIGFIIAVKLTAALVHRLLTGQWPPFGTEPLIVMFAALFISTWGQAGEELGWRGYALPRLWARLGLASASVVLGVIWAAWHLPLFFFPGSDVLGQSFPLYLLQVTALSVAISWLYWRTNGSLLLVMLMHAAVNNLKDIVPSAALGATSSAFTFTASRIGWITVALLWIAAAYFLFQMRGARLPESLEASAW
jgi:CAAX protease family protein